MLKANLDGIYALSVPVEEEDNFGPPEPGVEESLELELEEIGHFQISGEVVTALDGDMDHLQELIDSAFRRVGEKRGSVYVDSHVPMRNGERGFSRAFLSYLDFLDYVWERAKE